MDTLLPARPAGSCTQAVECYGRVPPRAPFPLFGCGGPHRARLCSARAEPRYVNCNGSHTRLAPGVSRHAHAHRRSTYLNRLLLICDDDARCPHWPFARSVMFVAYIAGAGDEPSSAAGRAEPTVPTDRAEPSRDKRSVAELRLSISWPGQVTGV